MIRFLLSILILSCLARIACAQSSPERAFESVLENLFTQQDEDALREEQYEILYQLYTQPVNLNVATEEELHDLFFLSDRQISNLLHYRVNYGKLYTIYELQFIPAFDDATIQQMLPFITVETVPADTLTWAARWTRAEKLFIFRQATTLERK